MSRTRSVGGSLELLVEPFDADGDWDAVVRRAGVPPATHPRTRIRPVAALAFVVFAALAAAAFATGLVDRFSSWVGGSPGEPAPVSDQHGFEQRNRVALASFPAGTKLRLLHEQVIGGTAFRLLGFRNGDAYCLRLARADRPHGIGQNECLRAEELRGRAALVAGNARFQVGDPARTVSGVFGFASDDVREVALQRTHGPQRVPVRDNVFLALRSQPSGTVQRHSRPDSVLTVTAVLVDGSTRNVPHVVEGWGVFRRGRVLSEPSYFGGGRSRLSGPSVVEAPIADPKIGWLVQREPRGAPLTPMRGMKVVFGRAIQPDPDSPIRLGIAQASEFGFGGPSGSPRSGVCVITYAPLARSAGSAGCGPDLFAQGALSLGPWTGTPIVHLNGLAADGIVRVKAFLAGGRLVDAALRDNVFGVAVPQAELGARLVGYDGQGRIAAIAEVPGNPVAVPCPPAKFTRPVEHLPPPRRWERIDLGRGTVAGETIIGRTPAEVQAILGDPERVVAQAQRTNGVAIPELRYGAALSGDAGLVIQFVKKRDRILANRLLFRSPSLVDARLGHVLRLQPPTLERSLESTYRERYRLRRAYGSDPLVGCSGSFLERSSRAGVSFGVDPRRPSRPFLALSANGAAG